jgi:hypothetical protein
MEQQKICCAEFTHWLEREPEEMFVQLSALLRDTHTKPLRYQPSVHVYPWVDLHEGTPKPKLKSIYSGRDADPREFIKEDFRIEQERFRLREMFSRESTMSAVGLKEQLDFLEASLPYNCEHVVPQSWFGKREPMRGDLHHLFACESGCNSFRGNIPYYDFPDFEEAVPRRVRQARGGQIRAVLRQGSRCTSHASSCSGTQGKSIVPAKSTLRIGSRCYWSGTRTIPSTGTNDTGTPPSRRSRETGTR